MKALPAALMLVFSNAGWAADPPPPINAGAGAVAGLPINGVVSQGGDVRGVVSGSTLTVTQPGARAVIDWASFDIDAGKAVHFAQPVGGAVLNRVSAATNASQISGALSAGGMVMLMNPHGVLFHQGSSVNVGALIATTGTIDENTFTNTSAQITGASGGIITNHGNIATTATAGASGLVALVAPSVINHGVITATGGTIALLGSTAATISLNNGLYEFAIPGGATGTEVTNAAGATLDAKTLHLGVGDAANLLSGVINLEGIQQAGSAIVVNGNTVMLKSALQAPGVSGNSNRVNVFSGARIQDGVDMAAAGGTVNVGAGTFNESVNITRSLTLEGAGTGQTIVKAPSAASGDAVAIRASDVTLSDLSINDSYYGVHLRGTANNATINRVAFSNNRYSVRSAGDTKADNFRMLNSTVSGGLIGFQTYNNYGTGAGKASFKNALFENVTVDGTSFKGFYFETADNLTMRNVTVTNAGNVGDPDTHMYGSAIDVNLKYDAFSSINFDNVVVKDSGYSSNNDTRAAVVIKTRGIPGDSTDYARAPASLQSVNITGGSIEGSNGTGIRFETLSDGNGGQPTVTITGGTQFKNNVTDIVVGKTNVDATGAVFVGAANGFAIEDRVSHALDSAARGLVSWTAGNVYVTQNSGSIQRGVNAASAGSTVNVGAGSYAEQVLLNKTSMTLAGQSGAKIIVPDSNEVNGISIAANNVTVTGMEVAGPATASYRTYAWGNNISRGIAVGSGITGFTISNNNIHDVRNGILIDGRNTGSVTGNRIDNTKSAISVQYTDGNGITMSGNTQGSFGNEWGLNLHLNGHMVGSAIVSNSTPISADPTLGWQQALLGLSTANAGWSVQDQAYTSSNRTHVNVAEGGLSNNQGSLLAPLNTVQAGVNAVVTGGIVNLAAGTYIQPSTLTINKSLTLAGAGEAGTVIDARSVSGYGIQVTSDNVSLRNFTLYGPTANAASSYGIKVSPGGAPSARLRNFAISNVTVRGSGRAELDLNGVDGATIDHVTADGAPVGNSSGTTEGAGIQLTDSANITVRNSTTRNNRWGGLALYQANRSYDQQVDNITVEGNNNFTELNPVYMQDESASRNFGTLSIAGFGYAVRNTAQDQYTWLQATQQKAFDFAVNLGNTPSSYVQGWTGALTNQEFQVGIGNLAGGGTQALSIATALSKAGSGANIRVGAGTYAENVVVNNLYNLYFSGSTVRGLTLDTGAAGTGISGTVTADGATGFVFNAPIRLLGDTTLTTLGADITLNGDIQNDGTAARGLRLIAGSGATRGNVKLFTGGTATNRLGRFELTANAFKLDSTLWVQAFAIDALGDVALSSSTLNTEAASRLHSGGNVTGAARGLSTMELTSDKDMNAAISGTDVIARAKGTMQLVVDATNSASLAAETINADVRAPVLEVRAVQEANISGASGTVTFDAPKGSVSGNFGQVSNTGGGVVNVNGKPQTNQTVSNNAENNRVVPAGGVQESGAEGGPVQVAQTGNLTGQGGDGISLSAPEAAGDALDSGRSVELDMSPRQPGKQNNKKDKNDKEEKEQGE